jgi:hypothetical protein
MPYGIPYPLYVFQRLQFTIQSNMECTECETLEFCWDINNTARK